VAGRSRIELRHLHYFVALAEELHFGRAADRLQITQPPLSQQIAALEKEIGVPLLRRTSRTVELTEAGRLFLGEARETLARARSALDLARRAATGEVGRLRVGFVPACGIVPAAIRRFMRRFPDVQVTLRHMASADQLEAVQQGRLDAGFVHLPISAPGVESEPVESHPMLAALPARHRLSGRRTVSWQALQGEPFIGFPRSAAPGAYDALMSRLREAGLVPHIVHETDSLLARLRMVAAGVGVSLLPEYARNFDHRGVTLRPLPPPRPSAEIGVVHCPSRATPALARFLVVVREAARV
jgi:DNA-binding transcriptional LysR family regulator